MIPRVHFDTEQIARKMDRLLSDLNDRGLAWRPDVSHCPHVDLVRHVMSKGAVGVAVSTLRQAEMAVRDADSVLVALPVALRDLHLLTTCRGRAEIILAVDHFVQAEQISELASRSKFDQSVLIDIDVGQAMTGIRPGKDAIRLAAGIRRLPAIRVAGLTAQTGTGDVGPGALQALRSTIAGTRGDETADWLVSLSGQPDGAVAGHDTECRVSPLFRKDLARTHPACWIEGQVVSRPALDRAVLDHGGMLPVSNEPAWLPEFPSAVISHWLRDHCVVTEISESTGLEIGSRVRIGLDGIPAECFVAARSFVCES